MDPGVTYMILSMMTYLIAPVYIVPVFSSLLVAAKVSARRLNAFFAAPEVRSLVRQEESPFAIKLENAEFEWTVLPAFDVDEKDSSKKADDSSSIVAPVRLNDISLAVPHGSVVVIVGRVASGKSSLLSALIGEMQHLSGHAAIHMPSKGHGIAYCSQQAWIMAGNVKENILFGLEYEATLYSRVLQESCLGPDLQMLPDGDMTVVGEGGAGLSGGQKQRLSLARACYSQPALYLLDDPLSALDPSVARTILHGCITTGMMVGSTRVLVTHHIGLLKGLPKGAVDLLIVMDACAISYSGPFNLERLESGEVSETQEEGNSESTGNEVEVASHNLASTPMPEEDFKKAPARVLPATTHANRALLYLSSASWTVTCLCALLFAANEALIMGRDLFLRARMMSSDNSNVDVLPTVLVYTGLSALQGVIGFGRTALFGGLLAMRVARRTHDRALGALMGTAVAFFDQVPLGALLSRMGRDLASTDSGLPDKIIQSLAGMGTVCSCIIMIIIGMASESGGAKEGSSTWVAILLIMLLGFLPVMLGLRSCWRRFAAAWTPVQHHTGTVMAELLACATECMSGLSSIHAHNAEQLFLSRAMASTDAAARVSILSAALGRWISMRVDTLSSILTLLIIILCMVCRLEAGLAGLLILYSLQASYILGWFLSTLVEAQSELAPFDRLSALATGLDIESECTTKAVHVTMPPDNWPMQGLVEFKRLNVRFRPELPLVLQDLSLRLEAGQKVALVGRTGSGKSSTIASLFRCLCPDSGSILIDGRDIAEVPLEVLRSKLAIVPQDPVLFSGSLRFNLDSEDSHPDAQLWAVLNRCGLSKEARAHPLGLDMPVEEGGSNFSAGQRQLLCLARALLRPARILVIDEATANVDYQTDAKIQQVLREHVKETGCTLITVAHRISTIVDYDRIAVMAAGRLVEFGSPAELMAFPQGQFRQMAIKASVPVPQL